MDKARDELPVRPLKISFLACTIYQLPETWKSLLLTFPAFPFSSSLLARYLEPVGMFRLPIDILVAAAVCRCLYSPCRRNGPLGSLVRIRYRAAITMGSLTKCNHTIIHWTHPFLINQFFELLLSTTRPGRTSESTLSSLFFFLLFSLTLLYHSLSCGSIGFLQNRQVAQTLP